MKKKVFREIYNQENTKITAEKAIELIDKGMQLLEGKEVNKSKSTKRGKKNVKSDK